MLNFSILEHYSAKTINNDLRSLFVALKKCFGLSTKGIIVFLASYAFYNNDFTYPYKNALTNTEDEELSGKVLQIRSGTDSEWNNLLNALVLKLALNDSVSFEQALGNKELYNKYIDQLIDRATHAAYYLLDNDLNSYKTGLSSRKKHAFTLDMLLVLKEFEEGRLF